MRKPLGPTLLLSLMIAVVATQAVRTEERPGTVADGRFEALGEPLERVLLRISNESSLRLEASRELKSQRVTVLIARPVSQRFQAALAELLSAGTGAAVEWTLSAGERKTLEETHRLRQLKESLSDLDLRVYAEHLDREVLWLEDKSQRELSAAAENPAVAAMVKERIAMVGLLRAIGREGRAMLLRGRPLYVQVGNLPDPLKIAFREYLVYRRPDRKDQSQEQLDSHGFVYLLARTPDDSKGAFLIESVTKSTHRATLVRGPVLCMCPARAGPRY
jgi:hypothetical protein